MLTNLLKKLHLTTSNKFVINCILVVAIALSGINSMKAQVANYQVEQLPYNSGTTYSTVAPPVAFQVLPNSSPPLSNLSTTRIDLEQAATSATFDDKIYNVALPFNFSFNGTLYPAGTIIYVSTNGFIAFPAPGPIPPAAPPAINNYLPISTNNTGQAGIISLYGRDMSLVNHSITGALPQISRHTINTSPNRIFKIEWSLRRKNGGTTDTSQNMTFQLWLYETSNLIEFHYNNYNPQLGSGAALSGQIGLRGTTNADYLNLSHTVNTANWPSQTLGTQMTVGSQIIGGASSNTASVVTRGGTGTTNAQILGSSNRVFRFRPVTCFAPTSLTVASITSTTATINWVAPSTAPSQGYQYYVGANALDIPNVSSTPTGTITTAGFTTLSLTGLTPAAQQYVYVRSHCTTGPDDFSSWVPVTFTTLCSPTNVTYTQNFDGAAVPAIPTCTTRQTITGNNWNTATVATWPTSGMTGNILVYDGQFPTAGVVADAWFYTQGINLTAGQQYRMSFRYGGGATTTNRLRVRYGLSPDNISMNLPLDDLTNIRSSPLSNVIYFTAPTSNVYYFGLNVYSTANQERLFIDDLVIEAATCLKPTTVSVVNITQSSALLTWVEPSPAPSNGYAYYFSTSATAPTNSTPASGTVGSGATTISLTGLTSNTPYYFWVRSICGSEFGEWVALNNAGNPFFTTLFAPVYCNPNPSSVDNLGITNVTCGSINNSTGTEVGNYGNFSSQSTNVSPSSTVNVAITFTTGYDYNTKIWVDWNNNGSFLDAGENVYTGLSSAASPTTLNASFIVPALQPLGQVRMRIGGSDTNDLTGTGAGQGSCYNGVWGTFEDYTLNVVVAPLPLSLNITSSTQCASTNSPLVQITPAELSNYQSYSWFPNTGVSGSAAAGYVFNTNTTTTYTLTGTMTSFPFSVRTLTFTYNASPTPSPITITPATATVCASGPAVQLTATGGIVPNIVVAPVSQNFNSGAGGWVAATTTGPAHAGGTVAASLWTVQNTGYNPGGSTGITSVNSNDSTPYYISNSDAQGSGSTTHVTLTSPIFSLGTYTDASLSFYHFYRAWTNGGAYLEITTNGSNATPTWVTLQSWTTATVGTAVNFSQFTQNLNAYVGQTDLRIRFRYNTSWGYVWAVDNVVVSGSAASNVTWNLNAAPVANGVAVPGLYTNAAATTAYIAGTQIASVYTLPSTTTTYSAGVSTSAPVCTSSNTVLVNVTTFATGTAPDQNICNGTTADIVLTGHAGSVLNWEYATNLAFTTPVTIAASASATLTTSQIGTLTATRYFRAVVSNGSCSLRSPVVTVTVNATTWNGSAWNNGIPNASTMAVFNGNYVSNNVVSPGNITACAVVVLSGNVNFLGSPTPHSLISQNTVRVLGGTLTFQNNASLVQLTDVANLPASSNGGNIGDITVNRTTTPMLPFDYTYWSSPVAPQTLTNLSPLTLSDKYFAFNPAIGNWQTVPSNSLMDPAKGYIIRAPQGHTPSTVYNGTFFGIPNSGTITTPIVIGVSNLNLIGNPYPSALNADLFLSNALNSNVVDGTIYLWTHNTPIAANNYNPADYAYYNYSGGTGVGTPALGTNNTAPTGRIASGQGFFIEGINAGGNVTFMNSMRSVGGNDNFYRSTATSQTSSLSSSLERNRVWLDIFNATGAYKQTMVGYIQNATNDYDRGFDGKNLDVGNQVNLYSFVGETKLGIQGKALPFSDSDIIPLGYKSTVSDSYSISLSNFDGLFTNQNVYLEDKLLNVIHDLKVSNYSFATNAGTFDNRFQLRFTSSALNTNQSVFNEDSVVAYKKNSEVYVTTALTAIKDIAIYDMRGRLLLEENNINSNEFSTQNFSSSQQVIIVKVTNVDGKIVSKKIIY